MPGKRGTRTCEVLLYISSDATNQDLTQRHSHLLVMMYRHVSLALDVDKDVVAVANADAKEVI
jgi:hypothetical protein